MIIGLGYLARSGKDTSALILQKKYGFKIIAFADPLKAACGEMYGLTEQQLYGDLKETPDTYWSGAFGRPVTPRELLQLTGTEALRQNVHPDVHVLAVRRRILEHPEADWVISDMRFPNEAEAVKKWGGYAIRVDRPGAGARPITKSYLGGLIKRRTQHASEKAMASYKGWTDRLVNNGTLDDLEGHVVAMKERLHGRGVSSGQELQ